MNDHVRKKFEEWISGDGAYPRAIERNKSGEYILMQTYALWGAWEMAFKVCTEEFEKQPTNHCDLV